MYMTSWGKIKFECKNYTLMHSCIPQLVILIVFIYCFTKWPTLTVIKYIWELSLPVYFDFTLYTETEHTQHIHTSFSLHIILCGF